MLTRWLVGLCCAVNRAGLVLGLAVVQAALATVVWDSVVKLTTDPSYQVLGYSAQRSLVVDRSGNVWVFWLDQRTVPYQIWLRQFDASTGIWLPEEQLTFQRAQCYPAAAAADCQGNVHVVWHMETWPYRGIWHKRYDAARRIWLSETLFHPLAIERTGRYPVIAALPGSTRVAVTWLGHTDTSTTLQVISRELVPDSGWTEPFAVTSAHSEHNFPALGFDATGNLLVAWQGKDEGNFYNQIFCRRRVRGEWQPLERVSDMPGAPDQYNPAVSAGSDGNHCHVAWHGRRQAEFYLRPLYRQRTPSGWLSIEEPGGTVNYQRDQVDLADIGTARVAAVWRSQLIDKPGCYELVFCERDSGGYWSTPEVIATIGNGSLCEPTIAVKERDIHIVWYDERSGDFDIYYRHGTIASALAERTALHSGCLANHGIELFDAVGRSLGAIPDRPGVYFLWRSEAHPRKLVRMR